MAVHFQAAEACFHTVSTERWGSHLCIIEWWFLRLREQGREWRLGLSWFALDLLGPSRPREAKKQCFRGLWPLPAVKMFTKPYGQGFRRLTPAPLQFVGYMGATRHFVASQRFSGFVFNRLQPADLETQQAFSPQRCSCLRRCLSLSFLLYRQPRGVGGSNGSSVRKAAVSFKPLPALQHHTRKPWQCVPWCSHVDSDCR